MPFDYYQVNWCKPDDHVLEENETIEKTNQIPDKEISFTESLTGEILDDTIYEF